MIPTSPSGKQIKMANDTSMAASLAAPCPAPRPPRPRGSSTVPSSFFRALATSCADRVCLDPSRFSMQADAATEVRATTTTPALGRRGRLGGVASPVADLSCARNRPFVRSSFPKEETQVTARAVLLRNAHAVIKAQNTGESISCKKIEPAVAASHPKKEMPSSTHVSARTVPHGVITKQKAGDNISCTRIRPAVAVQASGLKEKIKVSSAGVLGKEAHGMIKTKKEAIELVPATVTKSIAQIRPPAPAANHQDPYAPQDAVRAALAFARQARDRREKNVYRKEREEARRQLNQVVRTVFFEDPYITPQDVLKP